MTIEFVEHRKIDSTKIGGFQHNNSGNCFQERVEQYHFLFFFNRLHMEVHPAQPKQVRFSIICFIDIYHLCNMLAEFIFIWI